MLSRSSHAHQIWSEVVLAETHRRNLLSGSEVIIADTYMKKPVLYESRARPGEMTADANFIWSEVLRPQAYRRNLLCVTLESVLEKCLWRSGPLSFSMHADIPNSNRCTVFPIPTGAQVETRAGHGLTGHLEPENLGSHRGRASITPGSAHVVCSVLGQARHAA